MPYRDREAFHSGEVRRRSQNAPLIYDVHSEDFLRKSAVRRPAISCVGVTLLLASLCLLLYLSLGVPGREFLFQNSLFRNSGQEDRLDELLHPQDHLNRAPTTIKYSWNITYDVRSPDGVKKRVYLINDAFPGPTIEARSGDTIQIFVRNRMKDESVAIHWHGLHMRDAVEMDGAAGFTQCPIAPGCSFTYEFKVSDDQHGTFWYHAHEQVQRADGLYGGLIIHPAKKSRGVSYPEDYDEDRLLLIGDWYHRSAKDVMAWYMRAGSFGNEPVPDSIIVNSGGLYNCSMAVPSKPVNCTQLRQRDVPHIKANSSKKYRFRVVNTGTLAGFTLTISGANLQLIEVDGGHQIDAKPAQSIGILYPGARMDFIASWSVIPQTRESVLQIELDQETFRYSNLALSPTHKFLILLSSEDPTTPSLQPSETTIFNLTSATSPDAALNTKLPEKADITMVLYATSLKLARLHNIPHGFMNHTTWKPQASPPQPLILLSSAEWDEHQFVPYIEYSRDSPKWVDLVVNNLDDSSHPFHLHGYDFWVLQTYQDRSYWGSYNPFDAPNGAPGGAYNLANPLKRDTVFVPRRGYAVLRFLADNPGIWMFHCHIMWHQASGMAMGFQVGGDTSKPLIADWELKRRESVLNLCKEVKGE